MPGLTNAPETPPNTQTATASASACASATPTSPPAAAVAAAAPKNTRKTVPSSSAASRCAVSGRMVYPFWRVGVPTGDPCQDLAPEARCEDPPGVRLRVAPGRITV